jgi:hypothetical protein
VRKVSVLVLATLAFGAAAARADEPDPCLTVPVDGQRLQRAGKLLEARERFDACARRTCPAEIVADCVRWAQEVREALPSVVVVAHDPAGHDLTDATIAIDGAPAVPVSGRASEIDPGPHKLVLRRRGSRDVEEDIVVREGEKNREVVALFETTPAESGKKTTPSSIIERPVPPAVWLAGGVAAVGFATFATLGVLGVANRSADHCDTGCSASQKGAVDTELRVADVSLVAGVVALGIATVLYLARPGVERPAAALLDVRAVAGGDVGVWQARF